MSGARYVVAGAAARLAAGALLRTVRFEEWHRERFDAFIGRGEAVLFSSWHGRLLPLGYLHRHEGHAALISRSADGEYIARMMAGWGFDAVRGSTSRGGRQALHEMVRRIRGGQSIAITPDGPRGPRQRAQPGVVLAAMLTGAPILPVAAGCDRAWWPGGWDRFCIPKPFSRVVVLYGEPIRVPTDATEAELEDARLELEREMNSLIEQVDRGGGPNR